MRPLPRSGPTQVLGSKLASPARSTRRSRSDSRRRMPGSSTSTGWQRGAMGKVTSSPWSLLVARNERPWAA
ncbi:hypothetical protein PPSIR1_13125 [Plesiocystis pacifica SIR-1]|uniref:Uncharacterized protein n=1 Tax=Plesiocystis pacifica SIR-1 TaxID=391625 RepID=A6GAX2_9BACT|nr:hypothetical protein PPSIR1_13125 [Plesiocystis pacifica SIR-1]